MMIMRSRFGVRWQVVFVVVLITSLVAFANFWRTQNIALVDITGDASHVATTLFKSLDPSLFHGDPIWGGDSKFVRIYQPGFIKALTALSYLSDGSLDQRVVFSFRVWSALTAGLYVTGLVVAFRMVSQSWLLAFLLAFVASTPHLLGGNEQVGINPLGPNFYSRQMAQVPFYLLLAYLFLRPTSTAEPRSSVILGVLSGVIMILHNASGVSMGLVMAIYIALQAKNLREDWKSICVNMVSFLGPYLLFSGWILLNYLGGFGSSPYDSEAGLRFWYWRYPDVFPPFHLRIYPPSLYLIAFALLGGLYLVALRRGSLRWGLYALAIHVILWWQYYGVAPSVGLVWLASVSERLRFQDPIRRAILLGFCMYIAFVPLQIGYDLITLGLRIPPPFMEHLRSGGYVLILAYICIAFGLGHEWVFIKERPFTNACYFWAFLAAVALMIAGLLGLQGQFPQVGAISRLVIVNIAVSLGSLFVMMVAYVLGDRLSRVVSQFLLLVIIFNSVLILMYSASPILGRLTEDYVAKNHLALRGNNRPAFPFDTDPIDDGRTFDAGIRMLTRDELLRLPKQLSVGSVVLMPETQSALIIRNLTKSALYLNRDATGPLFYVDKAGAIQAQRHVEEYTSYYRSNDWRGLMSFARREGITHAFVPVTWPIDPQCISSQIDFDDISLVEFRACDFK